MKRSLENFRVLILLSGITFLFAWLRPYIANTAGKPDELLGYLSGSGYGAAFDQNTLIYLWWSWVSLYLLAHALAFFYNWFSRPLFIFTIVLSLVQTGTTGLLVGETFDNVLWSIHSYTSLFAFGMLFFSPAVSARLRGDWNKTINTPPPPSTQATPVVYPSDHGL